MRRTSHETADTILALSDAAALIEPIVDRMAYHDRWVVSSATGAHGNAFVSRSVVPVQATRLSIMSAVRVPAGRCGGGSSSPWPVASCRQP